MRQYHVYILASLSRVLYTGVTNDIRRRIGEHKSGAHPGFARDFRVTNLVYFETTTDVRAAIAREKQLKQWPRWRKMRLIEGHNMEWRDLSLDWLRKSSPSLAIGEVQ